MITCISPVDQSIYLTRPIAHASEIEAALAKAEHATKEWKNTSLSDRQDICLKAVEYMVARADTLGEELTMQMGRPIRYSPNEILHGFQERARHMISIAPEALADMEVTGLSGFSRFIRKAPLGLIFVLAPWNYPYLTSVNTIIPALLAGNSVILKHSSQTPLCAERYFEAFEHAGLPPGVFQFLHLEHKQVSHVISDPRVNFVAFTGSVAGGKSVLASIGTRFINAGLELGGKDPAYVASDANLSFTVENLVDGAFFNSGQSCCGVERIYVIDSLFNEFISAFKEQVNNYILDNPLHAKTTLGPMVRTSAANAVREQISAAVHKGAKPLINEDDFRHSAINTPYLAPQVLIDVDHTMTIMTEETFGPVVGIMSVKSDEEAIALMNDSTYGLTASLWTNDKDRAVHLGDQLRCGTVYMNRCDYLDPALAWTGVKDTGRGVTLSVMGFDSLTQPKSFHLKTKIS